MQAAQPIAFAANRQADIHDAEKRVASDAAMFSEVAAVLRRQGLQDKYGLTLLHKHFDLHDDEQLVEFTDVQNRVLTLKPMRIGEIPRENLTETNWCLNDNSVVSACVVFCHGAYGQHKAQHEARG